MSIKKIFNKVDKFTSINPILYGVSFLSFFNIIGLIKLQRTRLLSLFLLLSTLMLFITKNMALVLGIPLLFVNLIYFYSFAPYKTFFETFENDDVYDDDYDDDDYDDDYDDDLEEEDYDEF